MKVIVDISKGFFDEFCWEDRRIYALRLDFGFNDNEIVQLSHKYNIQLNASTVTEDWMKRLMESGLNVSNLTVCHNYYPRNNTGISLELLTERNRFFKEAGLKITAFVPRGSFDADLYMKDFLQWNHIEMSIFLPVHRSFCMPGLI